MSSSDKDQLEAVQAVVDRVSAYQDGAPKDTVETELRSGFDEVGIEVPAEDLTRLASAIETEDGDISAEAILS